MRNLILKIVTYFYHPQSQLLFKCLVAVFLFIFNSHAFADNTDLLQGTDQSAWATFKFSK